MSIDISNLAAKKDFIALKAEVRKLHFSKLVNVPTAFNNLYAKVDNYQKLKTVATDLQKLNAVVSREALNL